MTGAIAVTNDTGFDLGQLAGLREWQRSNSGDNSERLGRMRRRLPDAIAELTPRQRQMIQLQYGENLTVTQIAQRLGVNKSTVSRCLRRARQTLYSRLRFTL